MKQNNNVNPNVPVAIDPYHTSMKGKHTYEYMGHSQETYEGPCHARVLGLSLRFDTYDDYKHPSRSKMNKFTY